MTQPVIVLSTQQAQRGGSSQEDAKSLQLQLQHHMLQMKPIHEAIDSIDEALFNNRALSLWLAVDL